MAEAGDAPLIDLNDASVKKLIARAKKRGFITYDELNEALPQDQMSSEQIEDVMSAISEMGVNIVENEEASDDDEDKEEDAAEEEEFLHGGLRRGASRGQHTPTHPGAEAPAGGSSRKFQRAGRGSRPGYDRTSARVSF